MGNLTTTEVKKIRPGEHLLDGDGLRLDADKNGNASWILRFTSPVSRKERLMGLGPARHVSLAQARVLAADARALVRNGIDPINDRREKRTAVKIDEKRATVFRDYAERYTDQHEVAWKSPVVRRAWRSQMRDHVYQHIGSKAVADIDTGDLLAILRPLWTEKHETARGVRSKLETILASAKVEGLRSGENPATWRHHLALMLPKISRKANVRHHSALPFAEMPAFWKSLATDSSEGARMLRFIILTACRYSEARGMDESEVVGDLWSIPGRRMKAGAPHQVPLTKSALDQLPFRPVSDVGLAKTIKRHTTLPATTHGMRSTFRDWAGDETDFPREIAEAALAHAVGNAVEAAYRRGTALAKRRQLMEAWSDFCCGNLKL
ncbi:tyrosine-type recombinase/integrase [Nitrobacter sp. JJSN]|uniref:tyrosine-type recombinase/integrase n=1 Tax=Nitrobacter sp. JJSN TaxID=3453033 RepID=UPI003F759DD1